MVTNLGTFTDKTKYLKKYPDFTDVKSGLAECLRYPSNMLCRTRDNFVILHLKKLTYVFQSLTCVNYPCVVNATK